MTENADAFLTAYVRRLRDAGALRSPRVIQAFEQVPRHRFIDRFYDFSPQGSPQQVVVANDPSRLRPEHLQLIYSDKALVTRLDEQGMPASSASQPTLVATMLELLELAPGMNVLEIGAGTGYNAALMAVIVGANGSVTTLDISEAVAAQARKALAAAGCHHVDVRAQDGYFGLPDSAPYDRVVATVGCPDLSPAWAEQLRPDGTMLIPLEHARHHPLVRVRQEQGRLRGRVLGWSGFMPMTGRADGGGPWRGRLVLPGDWTALREDGSIKEEPRWEELGSSPFLPGTTLRQKEIDLFFALTLRDGRAIWSPWGVGLAEGEAGFALAGHAAVFSFGERRLLDDFRRLFDAWRAEGSPSFSDYRMEFVPADRPGSPPEAHAHLVRRPLFEQRVWLSQ